MMISSSKAANRRGLHYVWGSSRAALGLPSKTHSFTPSISTASRHLCAKQHIHTSKLRRFASADCAAPAIKLYQYHICPFCNITKSAFQYANLDYEAVEVNPLTKAELKQWSGDYKKVPIALIDEKQLNGTVNILHSILDSPIVGRILEKRWLNDSSDDQSIMTMQQFKNSESAKRWFRFAADDLGAVLYPNICGTLRDSYDAFSYVKNVDSFTSLQKMSIQYLGALAMYFAASKVKSKRNITDEKAALQSALDAFESEGLQNGSLPFSSGNPHSPDMGDLAVFGVLYAIRDMNAHADAIQNRGGAMKDWYDRMEKIVVK